MYGITETTVHVTYRPLSRDDLAQSYGSPIGCPIRDLQVYVLDRHGGPLPVGAPGELYVGGGGIARGYLNRPQLTAERFVANPFHGDPASRLYRTGDRCRWRPDGDLEFLGRLDNQVQLRGFRIELGEIESVLNERPGVARSVVTLREDQPGDKRLVGYYVMDHGHKASSTELAHHLRLRLPEYMVPSTLVELDAFPLTPNGKTNRHALPVPDGSRPELAGGYAAPRNPIEEQLSEIWSEILAIEQVGINDNFFELGGHSLLATQVVARIRTLLDVEVPLRKLFEQPTIAELAAEIKLLRSGHLGAADTPIVPIDRASADFLPLSFAQERFWY
jgi:acyl carrier protein